MAVMLSDLLRNLTFNRSAHCNQVSDQCPLGLLFAYKNFKPRLRVKGSVSSTVAGGKFFLSTASGLCWYIQDLLRAGLRMGIFGTCDFHLLGMVLYKTPCMIRYFIKYTRFIIFQNTPLLTYPLSLNFPL